MDDSELHMSIAEPIRQVLAFGGAGIAAAIFHYGTLIGLVEGGVLTPVPATLCGYLVGGVVSYALNRRHTYRSDRPHHEAVWRFATVAAIGFLITFAVMYLLVDRLALPYLPAQPSPYRDRRSSSPPVAQLDPRSFGGNVSGRSLLSPEAADLRPISPIELNEELFRGSRLVRLGTGAESPPFMRREAPEQHDASGEELRRQVGQDQAID